MTLVEIARYADVYEADLAAAFLESHGVRVVVTERHQTTVDPLMQRALGIRLLGHPSVIAEARDLLARARAGEFAEPDGDPPEENPRAVGIVAGIVLGLTGGGWGVSRPRRLRTVHWIGLGLIVGAGLIPLALLWGWDLGLIPRPD